MLLVYLNRHEYSGSACETWRRELRFPAMFDFEPVQFGKETNTVCLVCLSKLMILYVPDVKLLCIHLFTDVTYSA